MSSFVSAALSFFWVPLLARELRATANRKSYYRVRGLYAFLFFAYFGYEGYLVIEGAASRLEGLGSGAEFLGKVFSFQLLASIVFIPAIVSGSIAHEKERRSLPLLLTTDLTPARIVLQKFVAGLAPMLAMQLTALPLGGFAYALGGVVVGDFLVAAALMWAHSFHMVAFSLAASSWCRNAISALLTTYIAGGCFVGLLVAIFGTAVTFQFPIPATAADRSLQLWMGVTLLVLCPVQLILSVAFLRKRSEPRQGSPFFGVARAIGDAVRNVVLGLTGIKMSGERTLPGSRPVKWRELRRRALSNEQTVAVAGALLLFIGVTLASLTPISPTVAIESSKFPDDLSPIVFVVWAIMGMFATVQGAGILDAERTHQTLEVLVSTPIRGRDVLLDKAKVTRNLGFVVLGPLVAVHFFESLRFPAADAKLAYLGFALFAIAVVPRFFYWFGVFVAFHIRSRLGASVTALILLFVLCTAPFLRPDHKAVVISPASPVVLNEIIWSEMHGQLQYVAYEALPLIISLVAMLLAWIAIKAYCILRVDHFLGRTSRIFSS